ncbi:MAG: DUF1501 domain-containing protein [Pirellulaceae bacterium]|nr:DUF1501 domain-containing protein [Pirellulaceae bacterium]
MLKFFGHAGSSYCDRVSRRDVMKLGALGLGFGAMNLADIYRLEAATGKKSTKSIINIHLGGGPSHQDMWDLKPDAAVEYRGDFNPIPTNVDGIQICEHFPLLSQLADKYVLIRGLVGNVNEHSSSTTQTGYSQNAFKSIGGPPSIGSVVSKLQGFNGGVAPFVTDSVSTGAGYLGAKYKPFSPNDAQKMLQLNRMDAKRMTRRSNLLQTVDDLRRDIDASGQLDAADSFAKQAVEVVLSGKMANALDLKKEKQESIDRYVGNRQGRLRDNERFLRARRLVEAGVRCVSIGWGGWDTHGQNFSQLSKQLPALDRGLAAMIRDFDERGMLDDVTIAVWGEFGRTPRINGNAGRDHWPRVAAAFVAGGGLQYGQVIGSSDRIAGDANDAVDVQEVLATLYHNMGIDAQTAQITDPQGRPRYLLDQRKPIAQLI